MAVQLTHSLLKSPAFTEPNMTECKPICLRMPFAIPVI